MSIFYNVIQSTMFFTMPLLIVALAGMFSERSGVVNIALEGKMVIGAFTGTFFIHHFQDSFSGQPLLIVALILAMLAGILVSVLHAYAAINLKANQIISGVAINMFAPAFAVYTSRMVIDHQNVAFNNAQFRIDSVPVLGSIPIIGQMFFERVFITTLLGFIILVVSAFVIYKTKFGLRLRACGEHPQAADSVGISVSKIRYAGVLISGALAGIGGVVFIVPISNEFVNGSVSGYGFLALAVLIFGAWRPKKILFGAVFFGLMQAISANFSVIPVLSGLNLHANFFRMMPFIATLIVLAFSSKNSQAPKAVGQPYDKGGR